MISMTLDLRSFILGMAFSYLFVIVIQIFILSLCMAAGRNCPTPEEEKTELENLEETSRSKIRVINDES